MPPDRSSPSPSIIERRSNSPVNRKSPSILREESMPQVPAVIATQTTRAPSASPVIQSDDTPHISEQSSFRLVSTSSSPTATTSQAVGPTSVPTASRPPPTSTSMRTQSPKKKGKKPVRSQSPIDELQGEYATGRVVCDCGDHISFRDETTGEFDLKLWEAHRAICQPAVSQDAPTAASIGAAPAGSAIPSHNTVIYTPESPAHSLITPHIRRRRAKRTEDERINYLSDDPYVARFEPYRVLCASCGKWIRLRPNSTYCSIPWDAHRKSCLAKRVKNVYALAERDNVLSKDPDVRKFDPQRIQCNICDDWVAVDPDEHTAAIEIWLVHRVACRKNLAQSSGHATSPLTSAALAATASSTTTSPRAKNEHKPQHIITPLNKPGPTITHNNNNNNNISPAKPISVHQQQPLSVASEPAQGIPAHSISHHNHHNHHHQNPSPSFHDLNPSNFAPSQESRRRNAEQRAATLRADGLIEKVEANRVYCSLCQKWVQLRQDSSYCAYPWLQHRVKCVARHQRRAQKQTETPGFKPQHRPTLSTARFPQHGGPCRSGSIDEGAEDHDELLSDREKSTPASDVLGPESEEGVDDATSRTGGSHLPLHHHHHHHHHRHPQQGHSHHSHSHHRDISSLPALPYQEEQKKRHKAERFQPYATRPQQQQQQQQQQQHHHQQQQQQQQQQYAYGHGHAVSGPSKSRLTRNGNSSSNCAYSSSSSATAISGSSPSNHHPRHTTRSPVKWDEDEPRDHHYPSQRTIEHDRESRHSDRDGDVDMERDGDGELEGEDADIEAAIPTPEADVDADADAEGDVDMDIPSVESLIQRGQSRAHPRPNTSSSAPHQYQHQHQHYHQRHHNHIAPPQYHQPSHPHPHHQYMHPPVTSFKLVPQRPSVHGSKRTVPASLADLDSPTGRRNFIALSVDYLFASTYERTDDLTISALMLYLNSAMPQDKHEDFDTSEVSKAAMALQDKGRIAFEGDVLRRLD